MRSEFDEIFKPWKILSMPSFPGNAPILFGATDYVFVIDTRDG